VTTTSVKLPDELKTRAAAAARARGVSTHAFLVDAIRQTIDAADRRARFLGDAVEAREAAVADDQAMPADEVHEYLRNKTRGKPSARPHAKSWRG